MKSFAFVLHPISVQQIRELYAHLNVFMRHMSDYRIKSLLKYSPNTKLVKIEFVDTVDGEKVEGHIVVCPLMPSQFAGMSLNDAEKRIMNACRLGKKLGAKIIGLGGFTSIMTQGGRALLEDCEVPITNGNTLTTAATIDSIERILDHNDEDIRNKNVMIIGATGDIGSACSRHFSNSANRLFLVGRDTKKLHKIASRMNAKKVDTSTNFKDHLHEMDIIVTATSATTTFIDPKSLKSGSILCDVSYPPNINFSLAKKRTDTIVYAGGLLEYPKYFRGDSRVEKAFRVFNNATAIPGCLAETMILAMEKRYESFSVGKGEISSQKINSIKKAAIRRGLYNLIYLSGNEELKFVKT